MKLVLAALVAALATSSSPAQLPGSSLPLCKASDLSLATDGENGSFNGMSHSGTLVVLRNLAPSACRVPPLAEITFLDRDKKPLAIKTTVSGTRFMHPGPVVLPVVVASEAELTAKLRWVSGPVYDHNACLQPAYLSVTIAGQPILTPLNGGQLCGDQTVGISVERTRFITDPVYKPAKPTP